MTDADAAPPPASAAPAWLGWMRSACWCGIGHHAAAGLVILPPALWLTIFLLIPLAVVFKISFSEAVVGAAALPAAADLRRRWRGAADAASLSNYLFLFQDSLYIAAYLSSLKIAFISTVLALLVGYPIAYFIARSPDRWRNILLMLVILPFWSSFLLRVYAWIGFLKNNGVINNFLGLFGIPQITMLYTDFARLYRHRLHLPAVHDPAALHQPGEARRRAARGLGRSRRAAVPHLPVGHPAAVDARHHRRLDAGVHSGDRRVRDPDAARRPEHADDRPRAVGRVLRQPRLAARRRGRHRHADRRGGAADAAAARAERRGRGAADEARPVHPDRRDARLHLPLRADHLAGGVLVQREQAGDGVGRLFDQMVRRSCSPIRRC